MNVESTEQSFGLLVTVGDPRIDASVAIQFKDRMRELTSGTSGRILLDLSKVDFVDSSGLGAIVASLKQLDADQTLELVALSPTVSKVFRLTRMDKVFPIHETLEQASGSCADAS